MTTIGILGAGRVGTSVAKAALNAGYTVNIAASGAAADIALITEIVTPGATAMTAADAVASADLVVVAVPLHKYRSLDPALLSGKVVVDAMNYWAPIDGTQEEFESADRTTSEIVADYLTGARIVKSLNHIGYHDLEEQRLPVGHPNRRGLAVASDDTDAAEVVMELIDRLGFDPVLAGPLACGVAFQPGTTLFGGLHAASDIVDKLARRRSQQDSPAELERSA